MMWLVVPVVFALMVLTLWVVHPSGSGRARKNLRCPSCDGSFRQGVDTCPDCVETLVLDESEREPERPSPRAMTGGSGRVEEVAPPVTVFRTGLLWEADMAASALEGAGVPHYRRNETSGGLSFAMPAAPSVEAGSWWTIVVPGQVAEEALDVLAELPIEPDRAPGVLDFSTDSRARRMWRSNSYFGLLAFALFLLLAVFDLFGW